MATVARAFQWHDAPSASEPVRIVHRLRADAAAEQRALVQGLLAQPASISPKYFYDALGCQLFEAICELPEYYTTRTERRILSEHAQDIAAVVGKGKQWVDLGAGNCAKAELLLPHIDARRYVAVDIAAPAIEPALRRLAVAFPETLMAGVVTDFASQFELAGVLDNDATVFFYPGSSIGNFTPLEAERFLRRVRALCRRDSGLVIGVDTRKDPARLQAAYDDSLGVTAAFNRNVLNHVNAILGTDFDPRVFAHRAWFNEADSRIEMHLQALSDHEVRIGDRLRAFAAGEMIHTENSCKYAPEDFSRLLRAAGFSPQASWQDPAGDFVVFYAS